MRRDAVLKIVPYNRQQHGESVCRFNNRLAAANVGFQLPADDPSLHSNGAARKEYFLVVDGDETYGGYCLKHYRFRIHGDETELTFLQLPLSSGVIDGQHARVGASMLFDALGRGRFLYALGLGSPENKVPRMLRAAGWSHLSVPFFFCVKSPNRFARNIRLPQGKSRMQRLLRIAGQMRLASPALWVHRRLHNGMTRPQRREPYDSVEIVGEFSSFADDLFDKHVDNYSICADRTASAANAQFPQDKSKYIRLAVRRSGQIIGWAVVLDTQMKNNKFFGDLRTGTIVDCLAANDDAPAIVAAADDFLSDRDVDLVVSNQLHAAWTGALIAAGYQRGPSNFYFYYCPQLAEKLSARLDWERTAHLNRGSGHGTGHL